LLNRAAHGHEVDLLFFLSDWLYPAYFRRAHRKQISDQPGSE